MFTRAHAIGARKAEIVGAIKNGKIIAFPTDLGYFVGCNFNNISAVRRTREISNRKINGIYVIPINSSWIGDKFEMNKDSKNWISKLPGAYSLIMSFKPEIGFENIREIMVIAPNCWFSEIMKEAGVPIFALDVGMSDFYSLDFNIKQGVDYVINDGSIRRPKMVVVDLVGEKEKILNF